MASPFPLLLRLPSFDIGRAARAGVFRTPQRDVRFVRVWRLEVATRAAWRSVVLTACGTLSRRQFLCLFFFNVDRKLINGFTIH